MCEKIFHHLVTFGSSTHGNSFICDSFLLAIFIIKSKFLLEDLFSYSHSRIKTANIFISARSTLLLQRKQGWFMLTITSLSCMQGAIIQGQNQWKFSSSEAIWLAIKTTWKSLMYDQVSNMYPLIYSCESQRRKITLIWQNFRFIYDLYGPNYLVISELCICKRSIM